MRDTIQKTAILFLLIIFITPTTTGQESNILTEKWRNAIGANLIEKPKVFNIFIGDLNYNGRDEVSITTFGQGGKTYAKQRNRIFVFTGNGSTFWEYGFEYPINTVEIIDINNDRNLEHILSAGQKLERIQRGMIRIIGWNGEKLRGFDSTSNIRVLAINDINNDKYNEIAGGTDNKVLLIRPHGERIWDYPQKGNGVLENPVDNIDFKDVDGDSIPEIVAASDVIYYIHPDNVVLATYDMDPLVQPEKKGFKFIKVLDLSLSKNNEVLAVTNDNKFYSIKIDRIDVLKTNFKNYNRLILEKSWYYALDCDVLKIITFNADEDDQDEILVSCSDQILRLLDHNGVLKWDYIIDGQINDMTISDMDDDKIDDILIGSSAGTIYLIGKDGSFKWKYPTYEIIEKIGSGDLNRDGLNEIVIATKKPEVIAYHVNQTFTVKRRADMLYNLGRDEYISSNYNIAEDYLMKAKDLFTILDDVRGLTDTQDLLARIQTEKIEARRKEADVYYEKASESFISEEYDTSLNFAKKAKKMYQEFGDTENVLKTELLILRIEKVLEGSIPGDTIPASFNKTKVTLEDDSAYEAEIALPWIFPKALTDN